MSEISKKSFAKVNIFLKIAAKRGNYHELVSRFSRVHSKFDIVSFCKNKTSRKAINIIGNFGCNLESNTVYKMYNLIKDYKNVEDYFNNHTIEIEKKIPEFAGLGGGSSNAATFLLMANEVCELNLTKDKMCELAQKVGADVPFFVYEYDSANVTGIGEIVEKFDENILNIETMTPKDIKCNTGEIFKFFREEFYKEISKEDRDKILKIESLDFLDNFDIDEANDLYAPAIKAYPALKEYAQDGWYFSGSGSSFFRIKDGR